MTPKSLGALSAAIGVAAGAFGTTILTGRGEAHPATPPAAVSTPLSSSDAAELRTDMRELRKAVLDLTDRLAKLEGKAEAGQ